MRRLACIALVAGLAGCGTSEADRFSLRTPGTDELKVRETAGSGKVRRGKPTRREVGVIRGWADALRAGRVAKASAFFDVPVKVFDGVGPVRMLVDRAAVRAFNAGLPCGARLVRTERGQDSHVQATFVLTERPGPGRCGTGTGQLAATAFLIRRGHIVSWLRGPDPPLPDTKPS